MQSDDANQCVLQAIFRFPEKRNGIVEIFTSSYGKWRTPGQVIYYDQSPATCSRENNVKELRHCLNNETGKTSSIDQLENTEYRNNSNDGLMKSQFLPLNNKRKRRKSMENVIDDFNNNNKNSNFIQKKHYSSPIRQQHWHLQLHVYESCYTVFFFC